MRSVTWVKSAQNKWLDFLTCDLSNVRTFGVYIIWHSGQTPWTVYVGYGDIKEKLLNRCFDSRILAHLSKGLHVTWAAVSPPEAEGVVRFLVEHVRPLVEDPRPHVRPVPVNLPAAA